MIASQYIFRLVHFDYVKAEDLEKIGMGKPAIRRLMDAVKKQKILRKKGLPEKPSQVHLMMCLFVHEIKVSHSLSAGELHGLWLVCSSTNTVVVSSNPVVWCVFLVFNY